MQDKTDIDISIVIVNYNVKDFLYQCLDSIYLSKTNYKIEVIVVDNDSTDGSVSFLKPLFTNVNFIELKDNIGFGKANNLGFSIAKGDYILILNPDTVLEENTLEMMLEYMLSHPEVGISGCKVLNPDGSFQLPCRRGFPTPWAAFCKLFGLQKIFPKSKLFARYNQTFRSENETYYIDAIIGAFMFARKSVIDELKGFDPDFFMYGEDLDLCFRTYKAGYKVAYVHSAKIIHYKGESTKRSSINEIKHFYQAMEIFARKHISNSGIYLIFLKIGIWLRASLSFIMKYKEDIIFIFLDLLIANLAFILSTNYRFGGYFNLPPHAYPTVFIFLSLAIFVSFIAVGEYFEQEKSIKKSFQGLMFSFFILSSLTYYFNDYAFSRGVLLMTIGSTVIFTILSRGIYSFRSRIKGNSADKNIAILGLSDYTVKIINSFQNLESRTANLIGIISTKKEDNSRLNNIPIIGNINYLKQIIKQYNINEVVISDKSLSNNALMQLISENNFSSVKFHLVKEYDEVIASRILNDVSNIEPTIPIYNLAKFRYKISKRAMDILLSLISLTLGLPFVLYKSKVQDKGTLNNLWNVLKGKMSFIGLYKIDNRKYDIGKIGIIGLAHISKPDRLTEHSIDKLNDYYLRHYSFSIDIDILIKNLTRK